MNYTDITRGDILWLKVPQTLAPMDVAQGQPFKIRPVIALQDQRLQTDHDGTCRQERSILGMDCTSKSYLVEGRPNVRFTMPNSKEPETFAMFDSVRDINSYHQKLRVSHHLPGDAERAMSSFLDSVLRPEQKFFLSKLFNSKSAYMPGEIWRIKTIDADGLALILLRRGPFVCSQNVEDSTQLDRASQSVRKAPYLVVFFKKATKVEMLRGMTWDDLRIMSIQENAFVEKATSVKAQTSGILLNNIRARVGLPAVEYQQPAFKNMFGIGPVLRLLGMPMGMRP